MQVNSNAWLANSSYPDYEWWLFSSSFSVQRVCQEMEDLGHWDYFGSQVSSRVAELNSK